MSKAPSKISLRREAAEKVVKKHYGRNYDNFADLCSDKQTDYRLEKLIIHSLKKAALRQMCMT